MPFSTTLLVLLTGLLQLSRIATGDGVHVEDESSHIFNDLKFWNHFEKHVRSKSWSCNFAPNLLLDTLDHDSKLYSDATVFKNRRQGALRWVNNDTLWIEVVLGASRELANREKGVYTSELQNLRMLEAFADYVDHIDFFYKVASVMDALGETVKPFSQGSSQIHDIDKLDPVMMVSYSERFEDLVSTSVWDTCVGRHTQVNPHHEAHCVWHDCCNDVEGCGFCHDVRAKALREMVCDKVSRRVQKNLDGKLSKAMWDVEPAYFLGLPEDWLQRAIELMRDLRKRT